MHHWFSIIGSLGTLTVGILTLSRPRRMQPGSGNKLFLHPVNSCYLSWGLIIASIVLLVVNISTV